MNLSCYIVDDEPHAILVLKDYIQKTPGLVLLGFSENTNAAFPEICSGKPAVIFMDIDMPEMSGIEFARMLPAGAAIVFTTSYREYAPEAFELEAADYLLKPFGYDRFLNCIRKIHRSVFRELVPEKLPHSDLYVNNGLKGRMERIAAAEIIYICGALNYIEIFLPGRKIMTYITMTDILEKLSPAAFTRVHKSYIINHGFIQSVEYGQVRLRDHTIIPVGRAFRSGFQEKIHSAVVSSKHLQS